MTPRQLPTTTRPRSPRLASLCILLGLLLLPASGQARQFRENHIMWSHIGGQVGTRTAPAGFKLSVGYDYRLNDEWWFDISTGLALGSLPCSVRTRTDSGCGGFGGTQVELLAGIKYKFDLESSPEFVPYLRMVGGAVYVANTGVANDAMGGLVRVGGGVKYYVWDNVAIGGEANFTVGPVVVGCGNRCNDVASLTTGDIGIGVDVSLD